MTPSDTHRQTDNTGRHIHMMSLFSHTQTHTRPQCLAHIDRPPTYSHTMSYTHEHRHMLIYCKYAHRRAHTHSPHIPHMQTFTHRNTHAYRAPLPCRCSGACLASNPLSLHPSPASNPSLRRLPSVDQKCKTPHSCSRALPSTHRPRLPSL